MGSFPIYYSFWTRTAMKLIILDGFFRMFHTALIFFNLFGWIFRRTRLLNLITLMLTAFSWLVLGYWYGFGYCVCTDWHWKVLEARGEHNLPYSYVTYLAQRLLGMHPNPELVDIITGTAFGLAFVCSIVANWKFRVVGSRQIMGIQDKSFL